MCYKQKCKVVSLNLAHPVDCNKVWRSYSYRQKTIHVSSHATRVAQHWEVSDSGLGLLINRYASTQSFVHSSTSLNTWLHLHAAALRIVSGNCRRWCQDMLAKSRNPLVELVGN